MSRRNRADPTPELTEFTSTEVCRNYWFQSEFAIEPNSPNMNVQKLDYLEETRSIPSSVGMFALWLYSYEQQGGEVPTFLRSNFPAYDQPFYRKTKLITDRKNGPLEVKASSIEEVDPRDLSSPYEHPFAMWTPTRSTQKLIPYLEGAVATSLLVFPDLASINLDKSNFDALNDWRGTSGYGHVNVLSLARDDQSPLGVKATSSAPYGVGTYFDTQDVVQRLTSLQISPRVLLDQLLEDSPNSVENPKNIKLES